MESIIRATCAYAKRTVPSYASTFVLARMRRDQHPSLRLGHKYTPIANHPHPPTAQVRVTAYQVKTSVANPLTETYLCIVVISQGSADRLPKVCGVITTTAQQKLFIYCQLIDLSLAPVHTHRCCFTLGIGMHICLYSSLSRLLYMHGRCSDE